MNEETMTAVIVGAVLAAVVTLATVGIMGSNANWKMFYENGCSYDNLGRVQCPKPCPK